MREQDFYSVLGLDPDADDRAIRAAYRRAAREHHPDRGGSADQFHRIQEAWEVLGTPQSRADYDRRRGSSAASADSPAPTEEGAGFTYSRTSSGRSGHERSGAGTRRGSPSRSASAQRPPVYDPPLSEPEPLRLPLTSQRVHGHFPARGLFGGGRAARRHRRSTEILEKHVLSDLSAARLFNDVYVSALTTDRKGRRRPAKGAERVDHVLLCGHTLMLISCLEIPAHTASWNGRSLRAAGRSIPLPDLSAQAKKLRNVLTARLQSAYGHDASLSLDFQHVLLCADGDLFHPVVESVGPGRHGSAPLAAGRAIGHIANVLGSSDRANLVDRRLMAALRDQLVAPEAD
ncbi:MAG: J domain-containing protein [Nesterenkonia sp.]